MPKNKNKVACDAIDKLILNIESGVVGYDDIAFDFDYRGIWDEIHYAMSKVGNSIPFEHSFDEYDRDWFTENKTAIIAWLKVLSEGIKDHEEQK